MQRAAVKIAPDLPVFRLDAGERTVMYSPGHAVVLDRAAADVALRHGQGPLAELRSRAARAVAEWNRLATERFEPECLTLYLSNQCNLSCGYCYAAHPRDRRELTNSDSRLLPVIDAADTQPILDESTIAAASRYVARSCRNRHRPFQLVLHGGGEPTLHWELLQRVVETTQAIAAESGVDWTGYIATHGIISPNKAAWLAATFDHIGLSCDGPPELQDRYRRAGDKPTSAILERTAEIFVAGGARITARVTINPDIAARQTEIVDYLHALGISDFAFEPVYRTGGDSPAAFEPDDAEWFVDCFLDAQQRADKLGCTLRISGVRLDELHGPYCNVLRNTLHLTPDGTATACFLCTDGRRADDARFVTGRLNPRTGEFEVNHAAIARIRKRAAAIPDRCRDCVNAYHCVRECPDVCPVTDTNGDLAHEPGFRCRVHLALTNSWLQRLALEAGGDVAPVADAPGSPVSAF